MKKAETFLVNEFFETIQGEATYTGTPSVFIRLQGCPVGCAFCDTKHTWETDVPIIPIEQMRGKVEDEANCSKMTISQILYELDRFTARHVVITGGEPCMYDLTSLTETIIDSGRTVQIETSGTYEIHCAEDTWVTVSPKFNMPGGLEVLRSSLMLANEIKMPVGKDRDIDLILDEIEPNSACDIWLQPLSQSKKATDLCVRAAIENNWKVSIQTHKYMGVR
jgi:7-carboxy-7-deazaguanine synthase